MPSRSRRIDVLCPECQERNPFVQGEVVDAAENPPLVDRILDGTLFDFTCTNCEEEITLEFSARFEDHARRFLFQYDAPHAPELSLRPPPSPEYRLRRVTDQNAFTELARIWKDSLDDGVMLLVKHMLVKDVEEQMGVRPLVCSYDQPSEVEGEPFLDYVVWMPEEDEPRLFSMPRMIYDELKVALPDDVDEILPDGQWAGWNAASAQRIYEALQPDISGP